MNAQTYWMSFLSAIVWAMMTHLYPNDSIHSLWLMCIERFVCCISHFREFHPFKASIRGRPCITTSGKLRKTYAYSIQTPGTILNFRFFASWYIDLLYVPPYCKYLVGAIRTRLNWWFTTYTVLGLVFETYLNLELHHFYLVLVEVSFCNCTHLELHKLFLINRIQWLLQSDWSFNRDQ